MQRPTTTTSEIASASATVTRREAIQFVGSAALAGMIGTGSSVFGQPPAKKSKRVVVAGGGIGGLCCAYELMDRGHDESFAFLGGRLAED